MDNTDRITCPYCGKEMEKGEIPNEVNPFWIPEGKLLPPVDNIIPAGAVKLKITNKECVFGYKRARADYCPDCKIIITYTE